MQAKTRENLYRRAAKRQGYELVKSRRRDRRAVGWGKFMIVNPETNEVVFGGFPKDFSADIDAIAAWLTRWNVALEDDE